jgi:sensor domain CHASE-containing protein
MFTSSQRALKLDGVLFVERSGELLYAARLSTRRYAAVGKPSLKRANKLHVIDPKPGDLPMDRLKLE